MNNDHSHDTTNDPAPNHTTPVVAFLGPSGTFTETAMRNFASRGWCTPPRHKPAQHTDTAPSITVHDHRIIPLPVESPQHAIDAVAHAHADWACVAIESSVEGPVTRTYDALAGTTPLQIYRELILPIEFSILVRPGTRPDDIRTWSAHPVAHPQVTSWITHNLPTATYLAAPSNAAAAEMVTLGTTDAAAAPAHAAQLYGLTPLANGVADIANAQTRFVLISTPGEPTRHTGDDRTSVVFNARNEPGALARALTVVSSHGVDLTRIESRPTRKKLGEYRFSMDMRGHINDPHIAAAMQHLYTTVQTLRFLGSWPADNNPHTDTTQKSPAHTPATPPDRLSAEQWVAQRARGTTPTNDVLW
ncbi:prephenate dehydratase [Corynebacterium kroppenstedtii]|uniref:prephenate dehydratase n=1 Tax=Corynebacterium sp. PCR 32 TaxID=3351342 RepID=UPI00309652FB